MNVTNREKIQILNYQRNLHNVHEIYAVFERGAISPVLIKGLAAAGYYPKPFQREFSDIDLAVAPKDFEHAKKLIVENNFNVDLHCGLRHLDTVEWEDLYENTRIEKIGKTFIRILCPEDHLRVLCTHWLNDGGEDRTRLWDVYFALKKMGDDFDWNRFFGPVDKKRQRWLLFVINVATEYFGLRFLNANFPKHLTILSAKTKRQIEKGWKSDTRLVSLLITINGKGGIFEQIKKRFPPNVYQSIVETGSDLSEDVFYSVRAKGFILRTKNLVKNIGRNIRSREN